MGKMDESIIVVSREKLFGTDHKMVFQGTERVPDRIRVLAERISEHYEVMRRGDAEDDPKYKQPIPYAVLRRGNRFFTYKRLSGGGESRLHGKISLGVGGHMNRVADADTFEKVLSENLIRELNEELIIENPGEMDSQTIGLINDDDTEVGSVHIGVLIAINLPESAAVSVREEDKLEGSWLTLSELSEKSVYDRLETWSAFTVDALNEQESQRDKD